MTNTKKIARRIESKNSQKTMTNTKKKTNKGVVVGEMKFRRKGIMKGTKGQWNTKRELRGHGNARPTWECWGLLRGTNKYNPCFWSTKTSKFNRRTKNLGFQAQMKTLDFGLFENP